MNTHSTKQKDISRSWHIINAQDQTLGRLSTTIAELLMGKNKTIFTPHLDCGDYVVVYNAVKIKVTGNKRTDKIYRHHTGYPDGFKEYTFAQVQEKDPREIIIKSVSGMLPKNKLRPDRLKRLKVFTDEAHPYDGKITKEQKSL